MIPLNYVWFLLFSKGWSIFLFSWECVFQHLRLYKYTHRHIHARVLAFFYMSRTLARIAEMKAVSDLTVPLHASQDRTQEKTLEKTEVRNKSSEWEQLPSWRPLKVQMYLHTDTQAL